MENKTTEHANPVDFEVRSLDTMCVNESELVHPWWYNFKYFKISTVLRKLIIICLLLSLSVSVIIPITDWILAISLNNFIAIEV